MYYKEKIKKYIPYVLAVAVAALSALSINLAITQEGVKFETKIEFSDEQLPVFITNDKGSVEKLDIPTVESVDGGLFEDATTGVSIEEGVYSDLGWAETYDVSSPTAFKNDTLGKCIYANNIYGAQCVSLSRVFWWSYADRDVSTCGTGMAKGMMNCAEQNAGDDFEIYWAEDYKKIQAGDWLVFGDGQYGHIGMAMGSVSEGYVVLLGENQGGKLCKGGGAATNLINVNIKGLIGFYRPKSYIIPEPEPEPIPVPISPDTGLVK